MSLTNYFGQDPFGFDSTFGRMQRDIDELFGLSGRNRGGQQQGGSDVALWRPSMDLRETDKNLIVHADLPGVKKEDINIELNDNVLTISGERKHEKKEDNEKFHRTERSYGKFVRSMAVPEGVTSDNIKAKYDNGVLEVILPKPEEKKKEAKRITVG